MVIRVAHGTYSEYYKLRCCYWWQYLFPIYRNTFKIIPNLPVKFKRLIIAKYNKFRVDLYKKNRSLEFTFGYDEESGVSAIAIVHPKDNFSRKIGYNLIKGRIERMLGLKQWTDGEGNVHQAPYNLDDTPYIEVSE